MRLSRQQQAALYYARKRRRARQSAESEEEAWVRASSGYYTNAAGVLSLFLPNTLRTGTLGNLIEAAAVNLALTRTEDFTYFDWAQNGGVIVGNDTTAPDGTSTAEKFTSIESGFFGTYLSVSAMVPLSGSSTVSIFFKKGNQRYLYLDLYGGGADRTAVFDLDTAAYVGAGGQTATARQGIDDLANGWFRCWMSVDGLAAASYQLAIGLASGDNVDSVLDDYMYLWGLQVEAGTAPTSYIPIKNLLLHSETFDAPWIIENSTVAANAVISPDGTLNACKLEEAVTSGNHEFFINDSHLSNVPHTFSVYVEASERRYVGLHATYVNGVDTADWAAAVFDLQDGVVTATGQGATGNVTYVSSSITSIGDGWWRITLTFTSATNPANSFGLNVNQVAAPGWTQYGSPVVYAGTTGYGAYFWGAQLEIGSVATGYWRTGSANNQRAADIV